MKYYSINRFGQNPKNKAQSEVLLLAEKTDGILLRNEDAVFDMITNLEYDLQAINVKHSRCADVTLSKMFREDNLDLHLGVSDKTIWFNCGDTLLLTVGFHPVKKEV